jgi:hypothetical protein
MDEELLELEKATSWPYHEDIRRLGRMEVSKNIFLYNKYSLETIPKLPPNCTIDNVYYSYDKDVLVIVFRGQTVPPVHFGAYIPLYTPFLKELPDGSGISYWPEGWETQCRRIGD